MKTKKSTCAIIAAVIIAVVAAVILALNSNFVFIGGEGIRKDSAEVEIDFMDKKIGRDLKRLDRFSKMDSLWLKFISDDDNTEYIPREIGRAHV